ncbi:MAG TPA: NADH-quinone oxidoreductase subunit L, partial [Chromatiaceae bacterium]|nr:NADH-quinone oxidoreductase subunit L [Chromatiaceae bacterium]
YSTCSQLGYMFVAAGVGMYSVAMFHLLTHAFFKAMLFLGAGSVINGMHHEQDMRNYGGLRKKLPLTFWAMMIGTLAITGVGIPLTTIGFAGFLSKDAIVESAWAGTQGGYGFWMLVIAALFTSFYSWRLMFMTFFGNARGDRHTHEHAHESPMTMLVPLGVLAVGAVFAGMIWLGAFFGEHDRVNAFFGVPVEEEAMAEATGHGEEAAADEATGETTEPTGHGEETTTAGATDGHAVAGWAPGQGAIFTHPDNHVLDNAHRAPKWVKVSPFIAMVLGFALAWLFYIRSPELPKRLAENQPIAYRFLLNKWYFDEVYDAIFVRPAKAIGRFLWKRGDGVAIDGFLNGVAMGIVPFFTRLAGRAQSGYIFTYAFAMVIGIVVLITWMTISGGAE